MSVHMPAPWKAIHIKSAENVLDYCVTIVDDSGREHIAYVVFSVPGLYEPDLVRQANARLIEQAPQMELILREMIDCWHSDMRNFDRAEPKYLKMARCVLSEVERGG